VKPTFPPLDNRRIDVLKGNISAIDIASARATIERAKESEVQIRIARERIENLEAKQAGATAEAAALTERISAALPTLVEYEQKRALHAQTQERHQVLRTELASLHATQTEVSASLARAEMRLADLEAIQSQQKAGEIEADEWRTLERACGPNGIQALELDALAPSITEVANRLLSSAYGSRFQLAIETTRTGGNGARTKQIEDFRILVRDIELGTEQTLDTLSGGESVWVRKALYDAFGIIRAQNTGLQFLTVFLDEADGALDPDARSHYFAMIQAAHVESGRAHTIVITHSLEAQEMIGQRIEMSTLATERTEIVA
jgi:exonuclease SbcC